MLAGQLTLPLWRGNSNRYATGKTQNGPPTKTPTFSLVVPCDRCHSSVCPPRNKRLGITMSTLVANPDDGPTTVAPAAVEPGTATIAEQVTIAADDEFDDGYESDSASAASTSMASSVRDYAFENGRRYHKFREGSYQFPNDEPEQEREDMKHALHVNLCKGKLHYAPLENPQRVLDLGTGTGIWCIDSEC